MCTETFLRLPEEKRGRFLEAAWEEFTRVKFADASINQIVRHAGIPRGSFYQYFTDKEDLFFYLLGDIQAQVVRVFGELLRRTEGDIFQVQLALYDDIASWDRERRPMLERCFRLLQINPGIDLQKLLGVKLQQDLPPELLAHIRVSSLIRQDPEYVRRVFLLTLGVLGHAIMDALLQPERTAEFRRELEAQLEIIKYGCLGDGRGAPADTEKGGTHETKRDFPAAGAGGAGSDTGGVRPGGRTDGPSGVCPGGAGGPSAGGGGRGARSGAGGEWGGACPGGRGRRGRDGGPLPGGTGPGRQCGPGAGCGGPGHICQH